MKIKVLFFSLAVIALSSCSHHVCPTYQDSGMKYHHHQPHPHTKHHN